jgi:hypothetical protein
LFLFSTAHPVRWTAGEPPPIPTIHGTFAFQERRMKIFGAVRRS